MALSVKDIGELLRLVEASSFEEVVIELEGARLVTRRTGAGGGHQASVSPAGVGQPMATNAGATNAGTMGAAATGFAGGSASTGSTLAASRPMPQAAARAGAFEPARPEIAAPHRARPTRTTAPPEAALTAGLIAVRAPMVGTFFRRPAPDQPPLVEVGQRVEAGQPLCLIEVMKLFATVEAPAAGIVEAVLAEDGGLIEYDQPLFALRVD
jgi:acetyl-CoA carboxylase biotin carboxyl carrier protein